MKTSVLLFVAIAFGMIGCSEPLSVREEAVSITGRVSQGGQPIGNIVVSFHPLDVGHARSLTVNPDGTFLGELIAGKYSYYVGTSNSPQSAAALKKIAAKYYEPDLERQIAVVSGSELMLKLD